MREEPLDKLMRLAKYRDACPDAIRRIYADCARRYKKAKDAEHAARERLHGITGAFLSEADYKRALELASAGSWQALLELHASTRERLPLAQLDAVYAQLFELCGVPETLLDLACGFNPIYLAARYPDMRITAADISGQSLRIVKACGVVHTYWRDLICADGVPDGRYDLALLFKILPLLEREQAGAAMDVMRRCNACRLAVSFPTRTLGGRNVGMEQHYSEWMEAHVPEGRQLEARFVAGCELFYILKEN